MNKKVSIGILWADPYNKNLGVGALALSSLSLINDVIKAKGLQAEYSFVCLSKYKQDQIELRGDVVNFSSFPALDYLKPKSILQLILLATRFQTKKILGFDYVFDISSGDSFSDIYGKERFFRMLNTKRFFSFLGKKQILLPQTIGPFKDFEYEKRAFSVMKTMEMVLSRDRQSFDYSSKFLDKHKIAETIDVAFYLPFKKGTFNNGKVNVGVNVSGLLWNGGYTRKNQFEMQTDYRKLILNTLSHFCSLDNVQVHLIPHVVPQNNPVEDDYAVSLEIQKNHFSNVIVAPRFESSIAAKGYMSGLDFFTGARMHACIGAFSAGVPTFLMAYSRKFNGLFTDTLQYSALGDCVNENEEDVFSKLKSAFDNRQDLAIQIENAQKNIIQPRISELKNLLSKIIN